MYVLRLDCWFLNMNESSLHFLKTGDRAYKSYTIIWVFLQNGDLAHSYKKSMINGHFTPIFYRNCLMSHVERIWFITKSIEYPLSMLFTVYRNFSNGVGWGGFAFDRVIFTLSWNWASVFLDSSKRQLYLVISYDK